MKLTLLASTWLSDGVVLNITSEGYVYAKIYLSTGNDINVSDMVNISILPQQNSAENSQVCINYLDGIHGFQNEARHCSKLYKEVSAGA